MHLLPTCIQPYIHTDLIYCTMVHVELGTTLPQLFDHFTIVDQSLFCFFLAYQIWLYGTLCTQQSTLPMVLYEKMVTLCWPGPLQIGGSQYVIASRQDVVANSQESICNMQYAICDSRVYESSHGMWHSCTLLQWQRRHEGEYVRMGGRVEYCMGGLVHEKMIHGSEGTWVDERKRRSVNG
jgi:hypothetical protein